MNLDQIKTPAYIVDESAVEENLKVLDGIQQQTGCRIMLALKAFSMFSLFPLISKYLHGVSASSADEARLGAEEFGKAVHTCAPGYREEDFDDILKYSSHLIFNSLSQLNRFRPHLKEAPREIRCGIRVNPEYSEVETAVYNPCSPFSRLGVTAKELEGADLDGITGLHFHTLCEQKEDALERTLNVVYTKFGHLLEKMDWINLGGGHHITRPDYDTNKLCALIRDCRKRYNVEVFMEPGEAVVLHTGVLVSTVLDIIRNEMDIAILDTSAAAHMPDVLEMPYRPEIAGADKPDVHPFTYKLAGPSCLAGDIIGDYSFPQRLEPGSRIVLMDMSHYTMVKNNTFNGIRRPSIGIYNKEKKEVRIVKAFDYNDFRGRLS